MRCRQIITGIQGVGEYIEKQEANRGQSESSLPTAVTLLQPLPLPLAQIAVCWTVKCYTFHLINTLNLILMVWELLEKMKQIYNLY